MPDFTLCADDYALNTPVSEGILQLVSKKKLNAVSCMTLSPFWPEHAEKLKPYWPDIQVGLHFDLTYFYKSKISLKKIILRSFSGLLNPDEISNAFKIQIENFQNYFGKMPDFIDGHEHIHILPTIQKVLLTEYLKFFPEKKVLIRSPFSSARSLKSSIINILGARKLKTRLEKLEIPHNTSFSGIYSLKPNQNYAKLFETFLSQISSGGMIMCHPGLASDDIHDPIREARVKEFEYFIQRSC